MNPPVTQAGQRFRMIVASSIRRGWNSARVAWRWLVDALRPDLTAALLFVLTVAASGIYFHALAGKIPTILYASDQILDNVWFEADLHRVFDNMTDRASDHYRTKVHPLFSLAAFPPVHTLTLLGLTKLEAVRLFVSAVAGLWAGLFLLTLRAVGLPRLDAALFTLLACSSAAATFYASVAETYLFGSITLLLVIAVAARAGAARAPRSIQTLVSASSLSMTVTNWMAGIVMAFTLNRTRSAAAITRDAFLLIVIAWCIQKLIFPSAEFFVSREEAKYTTFFMTEAGGPLDRLRVLLAHGMVMPSILSSENPLNPNWPLLSVQLQALTAYSVTGGLAVTLWTLLLIAGALTMAHKSRGRGVAVVIALTILGQMSLHLLYGNESFLYTLHLTPLLVVLAAMGTLSRGRPLVLVATVALTLLAGANNLARLNDAVAVIESADERAGEWYGVNERRRLAAMVSAYPDGDWPRSDGHVILATAQAPLEAKGYHTPGGSFSPGFGSFGISIAVFNADGSLQASSNSVAAKDFQQRLLPQPTTDQHAIETQTADYRAVWVSMAAGQWQLELTPAHPHNGTVALRISSAGPAGGRLHSVARSASGVIVNDRWHLTFDPVPANIAYAEEWDVPKLPSANNAATPEGWRNGSGAAVIPLTSSATFRIIVTDTAVTAEVAPSSHRQSPRLRVQLPDSEFSASLQAQIAHLRMGLVRNETRPGDPGNYDQPWARDGAYTIVALARAGEQALAEELVREYARADFFGGFGAEADAPGLANWALGEVAARSRDPAVVEALWPHVKRKAELTLEMLHTRAPLHKDFAGTVIPELRRATYGDVTYVADPGTPGMINGTMDHHRPVLYVTAVNYLGLQHAATVAARLGQRELADSWRGAATRMGEAYVANLGVHPDRHNDRTAISALWPSGIVKPDNDDFRQILDRRWLQTRTAEGEFRQVPLWTYFELADAHQRLVSGQVDRTWSTLQWFWRNQASPGLYTWWEGDGEENSAGLWRTVRGWIEPRHVTPHYWTAAEMLLLQLDMLVMESPGVGSHDCAQVELTLGQGVPARWLGDTLRVEQMPMRCGSIDWTWQNGVMTVTWHGQATPRVKLGPGFPQNTPISLRQKFFSASG